MKLTESDIQDACDYIMREACKTAYGDDYKEKGLRFNLARMPITVRQIVDEFIAWLKLRAKNAKNKSSQS